MQISKQTIDILSNFSSINSSIMVNSGSELQTISAMKNILAKVTVHETWPNDFAIYDLNEFLSLIKSNVFFGAEYEFNQDKVTLAKDKAKSSYFYADPSTVVSPTSDVNMPEIDIKFEFTQDDLNTVKTMASILQKGDLKVTSNGDIISLTIWDKNDPTTNTFTLDVGNGDGSTYDMYFKVENLKLFTGDYDVEISQKAISHFSHKDLDLQYWIALEPDSVFNGKE